MGVIYKLKKDIVDFILLEKHHNPALSCRHLVVSIKEKFQQDVSKSSINVVIKQAQLSNPIGRPRKHSPKPPKFKFPERKRPGILNPGKNLSPMEIENFPVAVLEDRSKEVVPAQSHLSGEKDQADTLFNRLGFLVLKNMERKLAGCSILGELIGQQGGSLTVEQREALGDILLFVCAFKDQLNKTKELEHLLIDDLWFLDLFCRPLKNPEMCLSEIMEKIAKDEYFLDTTKDFLEQISAESIYFEMLLEDGTRLYLDTELNSIQNSLETISSEDGCSVFKATTLLSDSFIINHHPLIVKRQRWDDGGISAFLKLASAFQGKDGNGIKAISLKGRDGLELLQMGDIPKIKRQFIVAGEIKAEDFNSKWIERLCICGESKYYKEYLLKSDEAVLGRVFLLKSLLDNNFILIFSNIYNLEMSTQDIILFFIKTLSLNSKIFDLDITWRRYTPIYENLNIKLPKGIVDSSIGISGKSILNFLNNYIEKLYEKFGSKSNIDLISTINKAFFATGYLRESKALLQVELSLKSPAEREIMNQLLLLNRDNLVLDSGRAVTFDVII